MPLHCSKSVTQFLHPEIKIYSKIYSRSFNDFYINLFEWKIIFLFKTFKKLSSIDNKTKT